MLIWIVGEGGLLGSALARTARNESSNSLFLAEPLPWGHVDSVRTQFERLAERFAAEAAHEPWAVVWAAGRATVASSAADAESELEALTSLCVALKNHTPSGRGAFFLSSSAGGVYAGSENPPFSIETVPAPLSAYGQLKLDQEAAAGRVLSDVCPVMIGRISNLYGPGQDLSKLQGLISALARSAVTRIPINMFVSLDTIRDYIYADDAAQQILHLVQRSIDGVSDEAVSRFILASGQPVSLGYLVNLVQDIARVRIPVALGAHASAAAQSRDLRLLPTVNEGDWKAGSPSTPLAAGVKNVFLDVLERVQRAER